MNVQFLQGLQAAYDTLVKDANTFYYCTDSGNFYLGEIKLSNGKDLADAVAKIGDLTGLTTEAKTTVVAAINELVGKVANIEVAGKVTLEEDTTSTDFAKVYTLYQGKTESLPGRVIGTINIPKDMVVESGTLVDEDGEGNKGKFIKLVLANANKDEIYIDVKDLIDIYKAAESAAEVQLAVTGNTISATLVDGGVSTSKLADGAVTSLKLAANAVSTEKVADGAVTKAKLDSGVQASLDKADGAAQVAAQAAATAKSEAISTAAADATSKANTAKSEAVSEAAADATTKANAAQAAAAADATSKANAAQTAAEATAAADATSKANKALEDAKKYADEKAAGVLVWGSFPTV